MVFPFGVSVGDFISVLELVHDVSQALKKCAGARADFLRLLSTFDHIEEALSAVNRLTAPDGFDEQLASIKKAAAQCGHVILAFLHRNESFHFAFNNESAERCWKDPWKKIQWRLFRREDVDETRLALQEHKSTINLLLNAFQITLTRHSETRWNEATTDLMQRATDSEAQRMALTTLVQSCHDETTERSVRVLELLNTALQHQRALVDIPPQVLFSKPVVLIDARAKPMPFFLETVQSEDAFLYMLTQRFGSAGGRRIATGGFALEDATLKRDIDQSATWNRWFKPDQRVNMDMVFVNIEPPPNNGCPGCERPTAAPVDTEVICPCGMSFRRIKTFPGFALSGKAMRRYRIPTSGTTDSPKESASTADTAIASTDDNISDYARVRIWKGLWQDWELHSSNQLSCYVEILTEIQADLESPYACDGHLASTGFRTYFALLSTGAQPCRQFSQDDRLSEAHTRKAGDLKVCASAGSRLEGRRRNGVVFFFLYFDLPR